MNEDCIDFLLFLEFTFALSDTHMLLLPVLGADRILPCLNNNSLESFNSLAHLFVQLLLY